MKGKAGNAPPIFPEINLIDWEILTDFDIELPMFDDIIGERTLEHKG